MTPVTHKYVYAPGFQPDDQMLQAFDELYAQALAHTGSGVPSASAVRPLAVLPVAPSDFPFLHNVERHDHP